MLDLGGQRSPFGLTGSFPSSLSPRLRHLSLNHNLLEGPIPPSVGQMGELAYLNLADNNFSGGLPGEMLSLASLEVLYLNRNRLSGEFRYST